MNFSVKQSSLSLIAFVVILLSVSCGKKSVQIPDGILTKEELIPLLVDLQLAQSAAGMNMLNDSSRFSIQDYSEYIFKTHEVTKEKYDTSIAFYTQYPELIDAIYQEVINELSKKQSEAERKL